MGQEAVFHIFGLSLNAASAAVIAVAVVVPIAFLILVAAISPVYVGSFAGLLRLRHEHQDPYAAAIKEIELAAATERSKENEKAATNTMGERSTIPQPFFGGAISTGKAFPEPRIVGLNPLHLGALGSYGRPATAGVGMPVPPLPPSGNVLIGSITTDRGPWVEVWDKRSKPVGHLDHIVMDQDSGRALYAVVALGQRGPVFFSDFATNLRPVPWANLKRMQAGNRYVVDIESENIEKAPAEDLWTKAFREMIDKYYEQVTG